MTTSDFNESGQPGETEEQRLSKSARKREAATLQELGVQLSALPDQEIKALGLPDSLFTALRDLRRLPSHGAQVRQRQYIGKLMRTIDPEPVLAKLAERKHAQGGAADCAGGYARSGDRQDGLFEECGFVSADRARAY